MLRKTVTNQSLKSAATVLVMVMFVSSNNVGRTWSADAPSSTPTTELSVSDTKRLLTEVRSLRQDVKLLTELVERRLADKETKPTNPLSPDSLPAEAIPDETPAKSILFFTANWCGPCQQMRPVIRQLQHQGYPIQSIDVDENPKLTKRHDVEAIPAIVVTTAGKEDIEHQRGARSKEELLALFRKHNVKPNHNGDGANGLKVISYQVADIVRSVKDGLNDSNVHDAERFLELIDRIKDSIEPDSWEEAAGESTIRGFEPNQALAIRAPQATHEQIMQLLSNLRRNEERQIAFETRILETTDDGLFEGARLAISIDEQHPAKLDKSSVDKLIDAATARAGTDLSTSRTVTSQGDIAKVRNTIQGPDGQGTALELHLRGIVTPDGSEIRMNVAANSRYPFAELTGRAYRVVDGESMLFDLTGKLKRTSTDEPNRRLFVLIRPSCQKKE